MLQRTLPAGFIAPCLPSKTDQLPSGSEWLHEIKHDGFRVIARKNGAQVRLYSRPGNDLLTFSATWAQVSVLYLFDSWSIEIDGRINEKRYSTMRTCADSFRRLGGDRVSPQLP